MLNMLFASTSRKLPLYWIKYSEKNKNVTDYLLSENSIRYVIYTQLIIASNLSISTSWNDSKIVSSTRENSAWWFVGHKFSRPAEYFAGIAFIPSSPFFLLLLSLSLSLFLSRYSPLSIMPAFPFYIIAKFQAKYVERCVFQFLHY